MCDYSLHAQKTRKAQIGDKLKVSGFPATISKGIRRVDHEDINTATCMLPGTEVAFDAPPVVQARSTVFDLGVGPKKTIDCLVASFRQINLNLPVNHYGHHDAFEFANGEIVLINDLEAGQELTVLQLGIEVPQPSESEVDSVVRTIATRLPADTQMAGLVNFASVFQSGLTSSDDERTEELSPVLAAPVK